MKSALVVSVAVLWLPTSIVLADEDKMDDMTFVKDVHQSGLMEVQMGKLAQTRSVNAAVKKLGDRIVQDHGKMLEELQAVGRKKSISLSKELSSEQRDKLSALAKLNGAEFDRAFAKAAIDGHEKSVAKFEKVIKSGVDPEVKAWAQKRLTAIRDHLAMARSTLTEGS
jgi:putative membrane protein